MAQRVVISDPERIRALAHPLRLELIDYLNQVDDATATQCASHTGESVASCSFHLRMLAKYGYIEPAERRGREKPWKLVYATRDMRPSPEIPGSLAAVVELSSITVLRETERLRSFLARAHLDRQEWLDAATLAIGDFWLTRDEMEELSRVLQLLAEPYVDRNHDPALRPEGSRKSRLLAALYPEPEDPKGDPD